MNFKTRSKGTSEKHSDQNQLIENVCDRFRDYLTSEIIGFETKNSQPAETNGRRRQLTVRTKKPSKQSQAIAKSFCNVILCLEMTVDQFADAANIDWDCLQTAMKTGQMDYYTFMDVVSFLYKEKNETLKPLVNRLVDNFDTMCPSMILLGGPHSTY